MRDEDIKMLSDNILVVYDDIAEADSTGDTCATYFITDNLAVEILVVKDTVGEVEQYSFTMLRDNAPTVGASGSMPITAKALHSDLEYVLKCGVPEDVEVDVSLCGINRPAKESENVYRLPSIEITV